MSDEKEKESTGCLFLIVLAGLLSLMIDAAQTSIRVKLLERRASLCEERATLLEERIQLTEKDHK